MRRANRLRDVGVRALEAVTRTAVLTIATALIVRDLAFTALGREPAPPAWVNEVELMTRPPIEIDDDGDFFSALRRSHG